MRLLSLLPLLIPIGVALIVWWFVRAKYFFRERRSSGWPLTAARVENFEVQQLNQHFFQTTLYYSYSAQGHFYTGSFARPQSSRDAADTVGSDWQDCQIMVRYNPADPTQSVFVEKDDLDVEP